MQRDLEEFNKWKDFHKKLAKEEYDSKKAAGLIRKGAPFQFKQNGLWNYGKCTKLDKEVQFHPNQCMPENQECFKHRKD